MKKIAVIQGGIRNHGTSNTIAQELVNEKGADRTKFFVLSLLAHKETYQDVVREADTLVFVIPCYVNTLPYSDMLALELLRDLKLGNKQCYVIVQGGMPYPQVHQNVVDVIALFAKSQGWQYQESMIIGIAPLINGAKLEEVVWYGKRIKKHLTTFLGFVKAGICVDKDFQAKVDLHIPLYLYKIMIMIMNHQLRRQLSLWGYDPDLVSPYNKEAIQ